MPGSGPEYDFCELPTIRQLTAMAQLPGGLGWTHVEANPQATTPEHRDSYHDVLLTHRLRQHLRAINLDANGQPWLDDRRLTQAINQLERLGPGKLMEKNEAATQLLLDGLFVDGLDNKRIKINLIDFDHPERNDFLAISQFRIDPPGIKGPKGSLRPDLILFINGIPIVVIECKDAGADKLNQGIQDLLVYSNQRNSTIPEGVERLFHYNQLMISCTPGRAVIGTVGSQPKHYLEWRDTTPFPPEDIAALLGLSPTTSETSTDEDDRDDEQKADDRKTKAGLNRRQQLIAGTLHPLTLLDILRHYILFTTKHNQRIKIVPRYLQYRGVSKAIHRLLTGQTKAQHGTIDQRGGILWHYQGSGKSFDMVFILRKLRTDPALQRFKVVIVTDRTDLEDQLSGTAVLSGQTLQIANSIKDLAKKLRQPGPGLIFGTAQKFRKITGTEDFEELDQLQYALNPSEDILLLIDEAHRSHSNALHAYLMQALPNCAKIGFTGTPIVSSKKKQTNAIFGSYIDVYPIRESQKDGVTVPIFYEGLEAMGAVHGASTLDQLFEVLFQDLTPEQHDQIKTRYATKSAILKARELMQAKARHILRHYITRIMPDQFKAQLAANDREACVLYQQYLTEAKNDLVRDLKTKAPVLQGLVNADLENLDPDLRFQIAAYPYLNQIERLEFAAIISASGKTDPTTWAEWTDENNHTTYKNRFWKALAEDGMAILIVNNKLLVGFDAPFEQVLYVDRSLQEHDLLQAIARTNRTAEGKTYGLVVDYYGIDIKAAMRVYDSEDVDSAWFDIQEELPRLDEAHQRVMNFWQEQDINIYGDAEACANLLSNECLRAGFYGLLREFLKAMNDFFPRPQALRYLNDAKQLGRIKKLVDDIYRDEVPEDAKQKVQSLIDLHIQAQGINLKVQPVDILSLDFKQRIQERQSPQTRAAEMEHAIRHHIRTHLNDDPVYYRNLSERLESILQQHGEDWNDIVTELGKMAQEERANQTDTATDQLSPKVRPFFNALLNEMEAPTDETRSHIKTTAEALIPFIAEQTQVVGFWRDNVSREELRKQIWLKLEESNHFPDSKLDSLADTILQLAEKNASNQGP
jgi:type I restriction enzyme, R subunit